MGPLCGDVPEQCSANPYRLGDFVFSRFASEAEVSSSWNPLIDCSFGGAALFAPSAVYEPWIGVRECAVDATSMTSLTTLTSTSTETGTSTATLISTTTDTSTQ